MNLFILKYSNLVKGRTSFVPVRFTWIFRHAYDIPTTPAGQEQRSPLEKLVFQKYRIVENKFVTTKMKMVPVIFIKSVEGIAKQGEIVEIRSHMLREHYMPAGLALYATDYNVKKYSHLKNIADVKQLEPHEKLGITANEYELFVYINSKAVPVLISLEDPWTLQKWHLKANLRLHDIDVSENQIVMDKEIINGPNLKLQNKLFRFYLKVNKRVVMPCVGRYQHVTTKIYKQMLTPSLPDPTLITEEFMKDADLIEENIHVLHPDELSFTDSEIWSLMQRKKEQKRKELLINPPKLTLREQAALDAENKKKKEFEIAELHRRTFTSKPGRRSEYKFVSADQQALIRHLRRRHRNYDDDLHNWFEPLGSPRIS